MARDHIEEAPSLTPTDPVQFVPTPRTGTGGWHLQWHLALLQHGNCAAAAGREIRRARRISVPVARTTRVRARKQLDASPSPDHLNG